MCTTCNEGEQIKKKHEHKNAQGNLLPQEALDLARSVQGILRFDSVLPREQRASVRAYVCRCFVDALHTHIHYILNLFIVLSNTPQRRIAQLPLTPASTRGLLLRRAEPNPDNSNAAVELVFQIGAPGDLKAKVR